MSAKSPLRVLPMRAPASAPAAEERAMVERRPDDDLVRLAEDLQAAVEHDDIRRAREAHEALGEQLERAAGTERVIDLTRVRRERALRRGKR